MQPLGESERESGRVFPQDAPKTRPTCLVGPSVGPALFRPSRAPPPNRRQPPKPGALTPRPGRLSPPSASWGLADAGPRLVARPG